MTHAKTPAEINDQFLKLELQEDQERQWAKEVCNWGHCKDLEGLGQDTSYELQESEWFVLFENLPVERTGDISSSSCPLAIEEDGFLACKDLDGEGEHYRDLEHFINIELTKMEVIQTLVEPALTYLKSGVVENTDSKILNTGHETYKHCTPQAPDPDADSQEQYETNFNYNLRLVRPQPELRRRPVQAFHNINQGPLMSTSSRSRRGPQCNQYVDSAFPSSSTYKPVQKSRLGSRNKSRVHFWEEFTEEFQVHGLIHDRDPDPSFMPELINYELGVLDEKQTDQSCSPINLPQPLAIESPSRDIYSTILKSDYEWHLELCLNIHDPGNPNYKDTQLIYNGLSNPYKISKGLRKIDIRSPDLPREIAFTFKLLDLMKISQNMYMDEQASSQLYQKLDRMLLSKLVLEKANCNSNSQTRIHYDRDMYSFLKSFLDDNEFENVKSRQLSLPLTSETSQRTGKYMDSIRSTNLDTDDDYSEMSLVELFQTDLTPNLYPVAKLYFIEVLLSRLLVMPWAMTKSWSLSHEHLLHPMKSQQHHQVASPTIMMNNRAHLPAYALIMLQLLQQNASMHEYYSERVPLHEMRALHCHLSLTDQRDEIVGSSHEDQKIEDNALRANRGEVDGSDLIRDHRNANQNELLEGMRGSCSFQNFLCSESISSDPHDHDHLLAVNLHKKSLTTYTTTTTAEGSMHYAYDDSDETDEDSESSLEEGSSESSSSWTSDVDANHFEGQPKGEPFTSISPGPSQVLEAHKLACRFDSDVASYAFHNQNRPRMPNLNLSRIQVRREGSKSCQGQQTNLTNSDEEELGPSDQVQISYALRRSRGEGSSAEFCRRMKLKAAEDLELVHQSSRSRSEVRRNVRFESDTKELAKGNDGGSTRRPYKCTRADDNAEEGNRSEGPTWGFGGINFLRILVNSTLVGSVKRNALYNKNMYIQCNRSYRCPPPAPSQFVDSSGSLRSMILGLLVLAGALYVGENKDQIEQKSISTSKSVAAVCRWMGRSLLRMVRGEFDH